MIYNANEIFLTKSSPANICNKDVNTRGKITRKIVTRKIVTRKIVTRT